MSLRHAGWLALASAAFCLSAQAFPTDAGGARSANSCFLVSDWRGWKSPSPTVIYLRVGVSDVYRLDLAGGSYQLRAPNVHLINRVRGGSAWVCHPLDLDLAVADDHGQLREPLIVTSITKLSSEEAKAIPAKFQP